jgi:hypothetical protein
MNGLRWKATFGAIRFNIESVERGYWMVVWLGMHVKMGL